MKGERDQALERAANASVLLVASDFDGTLAPLSPDPADSRPLPRSHAALLRLAQIPQTHIVILSGRRREDLIRVFGTTHRMLLIGSYGEESGDAAIMLRHDETAMREELAQELERIAGGAPGLSVERKPLGAALHFRNASNEAGAFACRLAHEVAVRRGAHAYDGSCVVELCVREVSKGVALNALRYRLGATATIFIGDDHADEQAFAVLSADDIGVKVGTLDTQARFQAADCDEVARLLEELADARQQWLARRRITPIERHALLSDQRTAALVSPTGSIVWCCMPRFDSAALFGALLDEQAGDFSIGPVQEGASPSQIYDGDSFILRTIWRDLTLTDYLDVGGGRAYQRAGRCDLIRKIEGQGRVRIRFAPRLDFGRVPTRLAARSNAVEIEGSPDPIVLVAPGVTWSIVEDGKHQTALGEVELKDEPLVLELRFGTSSTRPAASDETTRHSISQRFWSTWASTLRLPEKYADVMRRSALVLKGLCFGPTGAIVAAPTMALPEHLGGVRNWDYRFCWPRDAAFAAATLVRLGNTGVALRLLDWVLGVLDDCGSPEALRPIYTVGGGRLPSEAELRELAGYGQSRPVLLSNAAAHQVQLDVFGPIAHLVAVLAECGAPMSSEHWRIVQAMVLAVQRRWREPDHGIWEFRGPRRHHVYSKLMCWHTVQRALVVEDLVMGRRDATWEALRDEIREEILTRGWDAQRQSFIGAFDERWLDAAILNLGLVGLLPPDDPRWVQTVHAIAAELRRGAAVYRYRVDDGIPGPEGAFHICTGWLVQAYAQIGELDAARDLFEQWIQQRGPLGLMSEQFDPESGLALGNFPQAYTHLAVINAALALQ